MQDQKNYYQILEDYCLRTPFYNLSFFENLFNSDHVYFSKLLKNQIFREAIYLASPDLYKQIENWENGILKSEAKIEKLKISILKYAIRISTRCTPFGLFALCSYGRFENKSLIDLGNYSHKKKVSNFDYTFFAELKQYILNDEIIKKNIKFFPNTSIYKIGNNYRYIEYQIDKGKRNYTLEGIRHSNYLENIISYVKQGKTTTQLIEFLSNDDISKEEAEDYINKLINSQILVSELEISITGRDYFDVLISKVEKLPNTSSLSKNLRNLKVKLDNLDKNLGNEIELYKDLYNAIQKFSELVNKKHLIQTDLFAKPVSNSLNSNIQKKLRKAFILFNKITLPVANPRIVAFKKRFIERYGDEEIPLNLALDIEVGLGYGGNKVVNSSLLSKLYNNSKSKKRYESVIWSDFDIIISEKLEKAYKNGEYIISISKKDVEDLPQNNDDLPYTLAGIAEIYKTESDSTIFIRNFSGSSSNNLLGRFCNGNREIYNIVKKITAIENNLEKENILAEIIHLPESRTGNILKRPSNRGYEIPYLAKSNLPLQNQIPLNDIYVSIKNDEIKLKSKRLNKYIQPRLGNAHNFSNSRLPIYLFLCELQSQNKRSSIGFSWNNIHLKNKFLPRVVYEEIIISKARWKINFKEFIKMVNSNYKKFLEHWKIENKIPDLVELVEGDNKLLIDLTSQISIKILIDACKTKSYFILEEFLFTDDELVKDSKEKSYSNQFIFSFYRKE
mgnify:CR=1 FL=1